MGGVMDSTVVHINKDNTIFAGESKGNAHRTQGEHSKEVNFYPYFLLAFCCEFD